MKKIKCLNEFNNLIEVLPTEFIDYLNCEFYHLYEYLSNNEKLEDFILPSYQNMVILESEEEINNILINTLDLEFIEEVELKEVTIIRIGIICYEDIQLHYVEKRLGGSIL
ncbi:hypothetical protein [Metabacillus litoralis]|uniref:hypothetical protein n=1 Tax=Metabacillus litoralis TaxID=152268 RepID=UPI001CFC83DA|nr:hypothetical protein [Metabacillus litoralis]